MRKENYNYVAIEFSFNSLCDLFISLKKKHCLLPKYPSNPTQTTIIYYQSVYRRLGGEGENSEHNHPFRLWSKKKKKKPSQRILQLLHFNNLWFSRCHFKTIFSCQVICFFCFVFLNFLFKKMEKKMFRSHKCFNLF